MKKGLIKEAFRLQQIAGITPVNEIFGNDNPDALRLGEDTIKQYFETMIEVQPDTVVTILTQLLSEKLPFDQFLQDTIEDIKDSYRDELNEEVTLDMDPSYGDNVYIKSTKESGTWHDWGWGEDENGNPSTALVKIGRDKEPKEFPLSDIEVWKDEEEEEPERDADLWRDIKYDR